MMGGMNPMMGGMNPMMGGMNPMMGGMNPMMGMMNPMGMAMGAMGMAAMMSGMKKDDSDEAVWQLLVGDFLEEEEEELKDPKEVAKASVEKMLAGLKGQTESQDVAKELLAIDEGAHVTVQYTHPQLGKITYEGRLQEKYMGSHTSQSYIQLSPCRRYSGGELQEEEASKRLMTGFVDEIKVSEPRSGSRSKSRSRSPRRTSPARP
ncbi:unnamed protein product [Effrenium voratum]|uniref:Uncharacterized protein n=1 Tax=Effrenium voratum TaxID=2562239 RepID=A0AA36I1F1_9DINO|nr:unnamed protein product [Effrenium voratum]